MENDGSGGWFRDRAPDHEQGPPGITPAAPGIERSWMAELDVAQSGSVAEGLSHTLREIGRDFSHGQPAGRGAKFIWQPQAVAHGGDGIAERQMRLDVPGRAAGHGAGIE